MEPHMAIVAGILFAAGCFSLIQGHLMRLIIGLILLSNAINLILFTAGRITRGKPPLIPKHSTQILEGTANPLAGALILTSIVISFGLISFFIVLVYRAYTQFGTVNADLKSTHFQSPDPNQDQGQVQEGSP